MPKKVGFASSQLSSIFNRKAVDVTNQTYNSMNHVRDAVIKAGNRPIDQSQGNLFEEILAYKFNINAIRDGVATRATTTASQGQIHAAADILVKDGNKTVLEIQAKSSNRASNVAWELRDSKYDGMSKVTNPEHVDRVRELSTKRANSGSEYADNYRDTVKNIDSSIKYKGVDSGGVSHSEAMTITENTKWYTFKQEMTAASKEIGASGLTGAITGGLISGAISLVGAAYSDEPLSVNIAKVAKDAGKGALYGGGTASLGAGIRVVAEKKGVELLSNSGNAILVASAAVQVGAILLELATNEEYTNEEAVVGVGGVAVSMVGAKVGTALGSIGGPIGAVAGSIAGYYVSTIVYEAAIALIIEGIRAERILQLAYEAEEEMKLRRKDFKKHIKKIKEFRQLNYNKLFRDIDRSMKTNDFKEITRALSVFSESINLKLQHANFSEFDKLMSSEDPDIPIKI